MQGDDPTAKSHASLRDAGAHGNLADHRAMPLAGAEVVIEHQFHYNTGVGKAFGNASEHLKSDCY